MLTQRIQVGHASLILKILDKVSLGSATVFQVHRHVLNSGTDCAESQRRSLFKLLAPITEYSNAKLGGTNLSFLSRQPWLLSRVRTSSNFPAGTLQVLHMQGHILLVDGSVLRFTYAAMARLSEPIFGERLQAPSCISKANLS